MDDHLRGRADNYIGRITAEASLAQAGTGFLLLVLPAFAKQQQQQENPETDKDSGAASV